MSDPNPARGNIFAMTIGQTFAGDFTLGEIIRGLTPRGALLGLCVGTVGLVVGLAILFSGELAEWVVHALRLFLGVWLAAVGAGWLVGSAAALARSTWRALRSR